MGTRYMTVPAAYEDAAAIWMLGSTLGELDVGGAGGAFPGLAEVRESILQGGIWFVVKEATAGVVGFAHASIGDPDRPAPRSACLVYIAVDGQHRRQGLGLHLVKNVVHALRARGVDHLYTWADPNSGVVGLMTRAGWRAGKPCVWMDVQLR